MTPWSEGTKEAVPRPAGGKEDAAVPSLKPLSSACHVHL